MHLFVANCRKLALNLLKRAKKIWRSVLTKLKKLPPQSINLIANLMLIVGIILIAIASLYFFVTHHQPKPTGDSVLRYQSESLSDEELAGSVPTSLNKQTGTVDQHLGEIYKEN